VPSPLQAEPPPGNTPKRAACIEPLYQAFARYPRFEGYVECTHCVPEVVQDRIRPVPLRALDVELLRPVAYNAGVGTFGGVADYKHFLPRLAELSMGAGREAFVATFVFAGLRLYDLRAWPADEQRAVRAYLGAWIEDELDALDDLDAGATARMLGDMARVFASEAELAEALRALPPRPFARALGHLGWSRDSLGPELTGVWRSLATAASARRVQPVFESLSERDDLHLVLTELLGTLGKTEPAPAEEDPGDEDDRRR
jgi:hypothetical protein